MDCPVSLIFLGLKFYQYLALYGMGTLLWKKKKGNIRKGVNIYWLVLCCSVVLQKRAVTRLVKELPTCGGVSQDCGIFFGQFIGQQFNSYKKQSET